jgi:drug/metabolite transporter superfamily protein YnfA
VCLFAGMVNTAVFDISGSWVTCCWFASNTSWILSHGVRFILTFVLILIVTYKFFSGFWEPYFARLGHAASFA